jgi:putative aldouronate transport system permease protein
MFMSPGFYEVFKNSILISIYRLIWGFPIPIILAILLNELRGRQYKKIVQTAIYLPHFISWVVIAGMIQTFLSPSGGLVNTITALFGMEPIAFLQKPDYFRSIIVVSDIWKETGWGTIMFLAALVGINVELYEAARIDGAGRLKMIFYITLPSILNTIIIVFVLRMGSVLRNGFEQIFLLQNPLIIDVADVFETYTYRLGLIEGSYDIATAVGLFQSIVGFILILTANKVARKFSDGGALW